MPRYTPETAERMQRIMDMRRARIPFAKIAVDLGISRQRAGQLYQRALREIPAGSVAEYRAEELDLIDTASRSLMRIAADPATSPRTKVEAWSVLRGWSERRSRLLGLDAPARSRVEVITEDAVDRAIAELSAEVERREQALSSRDDR